MATVRLLLGIIFFGFAGSARLSHSHLLTLKEKLVLRAEQEVGVREKTGKNDGVRVETYLRSVGLKKGDKWCAAFISFLFAQEGLKKPKTGWTPDLFPKSRLSKSALPGNLLAIYFPELKRIAHVGLVTARDGDYVLSIEGNTNVIGSREGDGVYRKRRHIKTIYQFSDWITKEGGAP